MNRDEEDAIQRAEDFMNANGQYKSGCSGTEQNKLLAAYACEMTDSDHERLSDVLHSVKGMVVISGYACELYDDRLYPTWGRIERETHADGARDRVEVLWMNDAVLGMSNSLGLKYSAEVGHARS